MFKKLKDKLAEEVKSSPQRIQQFAQAAQAAVTSASSSISDITNNDLFSIGDSDNAQSHSARIPTPSTRTTEQNMFQDVALIQPASLQASTEEIDFPPRQEQSEGQHQRRLSNSSFASDVSFRLPSYESPSLYHLQSDMEVSASEAEERGFSSGPASLDRVTKEQIYAAYKRTQQRYEKYRTQYADLARHYKFLERDNAKARSVLVETQDKALRRISELREQCTLEQSAKAHLEKALRLEIDEKNMKIETLNTKINFMQNSTEKSNPKPIRPSNESEGPKETVQELQLIDFSGIIDTKISGDDGTDSTLNNKTEKLEQLVNKYKESLKASKDKNAQLTTELHILSNEIENKNKENEQLKHSTMHLTEARKIILELQETNEELQNKLNTYEFSTMKEKSTLELDLQKALEEIEQLQGKIEIFNKREEEYAISLAENKLSIHKELESKETEINSLKESLAASKNEIQSLNIVVSDYKKSLSLIEDEKTKLSSDLNELNTLKVTITVKESQIKELMQKLKSFEQAKTKADEEYKCLQLQIKQETAEKLAMIDRNTYLESKNTQLTEENAKRSKQIDNLENELLLLKKESDERNQNSKENFEDRNEIVTELESWRNKYYTLETEIQDEREELVKLQSEIEKLLQNHEVLQLRNSQLLNTVTELTDEITRFKHNSGINNKKYLEMAKSIKDLKNSIGITSQQAKLLKKENEETVPILKNKFTDFITASQNNEYELEKLKHDLIDLKHELQSTSSNFIACQEDNRQLEMQLASAVKERSSIKEDFENIESNFKQMLDEISNLKDEKSLSATKVVEREQLIRSLETTISKEKEENSSLQDKLSILEEEQKSLLQKLKHLEVDNDQYEAEVSKLEVYKLKNQELLSKLQESDHKKVYIENLEDKVSVLSQENASLKNQSESISRSLKTLEKEISDVRKSHAEIENEKNNLNTTIQKLEESEYSKKLTSTVEIQTEEDPTALDLAIEGNKILKDKCEQFKQEKETLYDKVISVENEKESLRSNLATQILYSSNFEEENNNLKKNNSELLVRISELEKSCQESNVNEMKFTEKLEIINAECNKLKDENRRLSSDIEGLQNYLAKISKENSALTDKLRESIASSEHVDKYENAIRDFSDLQNGQSDTNKINDLLRENTLLIEENLELKDQLHSQNYTETPNNNCKNNDTEFELDDLKEKYNSLLATKSKYEKQLSDLEHINMSVNGNMRTVQENNEKLRLSNEKLERRLDEALVSLRHLHSLQENTELEYLRNILYEYLTGSGTHSITLAKVLAAVVKFDKTQTNNVIQKEKERQGLLRQLGLL